MLQALNAGNIINKELLWKDVRLEDRQRHGEKFILELIDWKENGDPYFYENHHLSALPIEDTRAPGCEESWIFYDTPKFSGKRLIVEPGGAFASRDDGVYTVFVWHGTGTFGGLEVRGGEPGLDEVIVTHDRAIRGVEVRNTGAETLMLIKFFGPDVNLHVPTIARR